MNKRNIFLFDTNYQIGLFELNRNHKDNDDYFRKLKLCKTREKKMSNQKRVQLSITFL